MAYRVSTRAELVAIAPALAVMAADESEGNLYSILAESAARQAGSDLGDQRSFVHALLIAHWATIGTSGEAGPISSASEREVSVSFATATPLDTAGLGSTKYGRQAQALILTQVRCVTVWR